MDVEFDGMDFTIILTWYELAFAKKENHKKKDMELLEKIKVMARQYIKDMEALKAEDEKD